MNYTLLIGIPSFGIPDPQFAIDSLSSLTYHIGRRHPEIETIFLQRDTRTYRQEARQSIVKGAQELNVTHLLMLDDDHVFDGDVFTKLWNAHLEDTENRLFISALYFTKGPGPAPCIFKCTDEGTAPMFYYPENQLFDVDVVGFGFTLYDMRIFQRVDPPWFNLSIGFGEDAAFCARMIQAGIKVWVHTGAKIGHIPTERKPVTEEDYLHVREIMERSGQPIQAPQLVPDSGGGGFSIPECGYSKGSRHPWWRPRFTRIWKRDSDISTGVRRPERISAARVQGC